MSSAAVAHYNLLEMMGEGGLGPVYRARDTRTGRTVAIKLVSAGLLGDPGSRAQLLADAAAAAAVSHPGIATLSDFGDHDGGVYLAYEFAPGVTLREELGGGALAARRSIDIAIQAADALAEGHAMSVLHGDLRPDNIVITPKGAAKLLDLGMARWTGAGNARRIAASAPQSLGIEALPVVSYLSPEEALGHPLEARSDVFSLAVVLYEMLTGRNPFTGRDAAATIMNIIRETPAVPSSLNRNLPPAVDAILGRALAKDIDVRPDGAASFASQLRKIADTLQARSRDSVTAAAAMPFDNEGAGTGKWIAVAVGLGVLVIFLWYFASQ
jgi:eukaryotic-like serine/threonine-protein kinase